VPRRAGSVPGCSDAEVLTLAPVRHLLGRPGERGFLADGGRDWAHFFPVLPAQSKMSRGMQRSLEEAGAPPHYPGDNTNRPREGTHDQTLDGS
jgi:hypothetical protein